jgi:hypothetical protein
VANRQARLSPADLALKRQTRETIAAAGGQERASRYCRIGQQTLSDCGAPNVDRFIPVDALRDLEIVTKGAPGWPHTLQQVAIQIGCSVVILPDAAPCSGDWHQRIAELTKEHSDVATALMVSLATGSICARDVRERELLRELDELIQIGVNLRAMLEQVVRDA